MLFCNTKEKVNFPKIWQQGVCSCMAARWWCHWKEYLPKSCIISPFSSPYTSTPQLVRVREGSHTLHLLHPEAAPLMGVPSIVVLLLVHNLQEWLESFLSGVGKLRGQAGKIPLFCSKTKLVFSLFVFFSLFASFSSCFPLAICLFCLVQIVWLSKETNPPCVNTS